MKDKFYYIVGVSLLVLLILVVYVGSRVQNVEMGLANVDARLAAIESALGVSESTSYYGDDSYGASAYDAFYPEEYSYDYDYTTE